MQPRADSLLTDLAHRVRLPAQLLVVLERCTLTLSRTRCPSPSGGSRVDGGRGSGARREQTNAAAYSRLWWRAAIRAAFQHSSLPSIRRARPVARPPVRARAHSRTVCLTFRHQSRRLLTAVGRAFLPLNETFAACTEFIRSTRGNIRPPWHAAPRCHASAARASQILPPRTQLCRQLGAVVGPSPSVRFRNSTRHRAGCAETNAAWLRRR
jgi:hypothetical protein